MKKVFAVTLIIVLIATAAITAATFIFLPDIGEIEVMPHTRQTISCVAGRSMYGGADYRISAENGHLYAYSNDNTRKVLDDVKELYRTMNNNLGTVITVFAIRNNGDLYACGSNENGALGDGTGNDSEKFIKILDNVMQLAVYDHGSYSAFQALTSDGSVYFWGKNNRYAGLDIAKEAYYEPTKLPCENIAYLLEFNQGVSNEGKLINDLFNGGTKPVSNGLLGIAQAINGSADSIANCYTMADTFMEDKYRLKVNGDLYWNGELIAENVVDVFGYFGGYREYFGASYLTDSGELFSTGENIGDGTKVPKSGFVKLRDDVAQLIHSSDSHRYILTKSGKVMGIDDSSMYIEVTSNVKSIFVSEKGLLACKKDNNLYTLPTQYIDSTIDKVWSDVKAPQMIPLKTPLSIPDTEARDHFIETMLTIAVAIWSVFVGGWLLVFLLWGLWQMIPSGPSGPTCGNCKHFSMMLRNGVPYASSCAKGVRIMPTHNQSACTKYE